MTFERAFMKIKTILKFCLTSTVLLAFIAALPFLIYLYVLPYAVSNPKVINYAQNIVEKAYPDTKLEIKTPYLKTSLSPEVKFGVEELSISTTKSPKIFIVENFDTDLSLKEIIKKKNVIINFVDADSIFVDVNKFLALPFFKQEQKTQKSEYSVDIFHSTLDVKNLDILYDIDKKTKMKLNAKNFGIIPQNADKKITYNANLFITKGTETIKLSAIDDGNIYLKNNEKIIIKNSKILVERGNKAKSIVNLKGFVDSKYNYSVNLRAKNFQIPEVLSLLDTQIIENNIGEQLVYFKDISGNFDFDVSADNKNMNGSVKLNKLRFKLIPLMDLPILLTNGDVKFDNYKIDLKNFKGYYNDKPANKMDFGGTVKDYLKTIDTDLTGNAIVADDFAKNYLSKMINYPIRITGKADTRVMLKSKNNKIDLTWLYMFKKGNGFVIDGEESVMNDDANRVLAAKMHFEDMLLNIKSLDYFADRGTVDGKKLKPINIVSMNGNIDFSNGQTFVKDFGFSLPKPMPSGFINMLLKEKLFKNGNFSGNMRIIYTGKYPVLEGSMKVDKVAIPAQRLFIKSGEFTAKNNLINIKSDGRYRRSKYDLDGSIVNEIKFPIVVKNITLNLDNIDIEKYLQAFNAQQPTQVSDNVQAEIARSIEQGGDDVDAEANAQAFDLANLIVENGVLKVAKGFYKGINFSDVIATMSLDKNSFLKITSNKFNIAEGISTAKIDCDLKNHKYAVRLGVKDVNSDIIAASLLNLSKEIQGKAMGLIELNTDDSLKLNGRIQFRVDEGIIGKVGLIEYVMKVAAIFRNPVTMVSPSIVSDLVSIPEGSFDIIKGDLRIKDNVVYPLMIRSTAPQLSSYIIGTYNLENQDAALRIYTKFSNRKKGPFGFLRNLSLNALSNHIPMSGNNDINYYSAEISQIPPIDADEKDCQIFLTKVDGDIEHNNFISSLKKLK